ncbi:ferrochelatase [Parahaliea aestuarii]|uniref:Ferrochelatase n=1 Tax=Parahaliea aestuarii TaxID=1852021 RepID=A0A5C8ZS23_9GAMM|nr:ferrochelatase [Parahaliea aestuarii]TXS90382.1 ferrochelatase [Parahaliea aestuarii]
MSKAAQHPTSVGSGNSGEGPVGILITNLGTPDAPTRGALRRYLKEFLWDPRVVEAPRWLWWLVLNGIILNVRPSRSAAAYRKIWTEDGSPLLFHTRDQAHHLQAAMSANHGDSVLVEFAMRYGNPSIDAGIESLWQRGARRFLVLPLYPQYSGPASASTFDAIGAAFRQRRWVPPLRFVSDYHDHPAYISALANSVRQHWQSHPKAQRLLLSYHGEPQRYVDRGDPYYQQCRRSSELLAQALALGADEWSFCFQSRFGREPWLQPYADETLKALPAEGVTSVQVICPGFSADCLETIEEIGMENRDTFMDAGGERYEYIPCLNAGDRHIAALRQIVEENLAGWLRRAN